MKTSESARVSDSTRLPADPMLTEEEEARVVDGLAPAFPDVARDEIRRRVEAHNRDPAVRCPRYLSALVQGELMTWRARIRASEPEPP